jgi:hypothetical protein
MFTLLKQIDLRDIVDGTLTNTVGQLRSTSSIQLVVGADPGPLAHLVSQGVTVAAFLSAEFARPNWRPDYDETPRTWDALVEEVGYQRAMKLRRRDREGE